VNRIYLLITLCFALPLIAKHGQGAGPSGDKPTESEVKSQPKADACPRCNKNTHKNKRAYCTVEQNNPRTKCGHWVCQKCADDMQSDAFWTMSKKHTMKCPVCDKEIKGFVDAAGDSYPSEQATGYSL